MKITCPRYQNTTEQVQSRETRTRSQHYKCKSYQCLYTPEPKLQSYPDEQLREAVGMYVDGQNFRQIARQPRVDHKSIINLVNVHAAPQTQAPVPTAINNPELDDLFPFVRSKKPRLRDDTGR